MVHFGQAISLLGYDLARPGDGSVSLRLHWRADQPVDQDYTVFAHLLDGQGKFVTAADSQPGLGDLPTSTWGPGEIIVDEHHLTPPAGAQTPKLEFGLYLLATGQRLPATAADGTPLGDAVTLPSQ